MIAYFDTSALIPLLVAEPGTARSRTMWDAADRVSAVRLVYPEARAAAARAFRLGRLTSRQLRAAVRRLDTYLQQIDVVEIDDRLSRRAGHLAELHALRGYDAVHLAAAERVRAPDFVVVAGDGDLIQAATSEGMAVAAV